MKKIIRILLLIAVVAVVGFTAKRRLAATSTPNGALTLYGNVDIRQVALGFRVPGRIASMTFEEGDVVTAGQVLATVDQGPLEDSLAIFRAQVAVAEASVAKLEAGTRPGEIAQAKAAVHERETALANARKAYERQSALVKSGATSAQAADDASAQRDAAAARLQSVQEVLSLAEEGPRAEDIAIARAELVAARAKVAQAERQLADAELMAPANGIVLTRVQEPGGIVPIGATVYTLSLQEPVWVRAYVAEPDLGRIHPGMQAEVFTDSRPDQPYPGQVGFISPVAEFTPKSVETVELRTDLVYRLRIIVKVPDEALRQGMPVTVRFPEAPKGDNA